MRRQLALPTAAAVLALGPAAQAHVSVHPNVLPAGQFVQIVLRVPNERDDAATTKIDVRFPPGFIFVSTAPVQGWKAEIVRRTLNKPVTVFGEEHTEEIGDVIFSGGRIEAGQFVEFPLSVAIPDKPAGTMLTFKALQTYSSGEVVRWIGSPTAESPAPQIAVTSSEGGIQDVPSAKGAAAAAIGVAKTATGEDDDDSSVPEAVTFGLAVVAAILAAVALAVALSARRRADSRERST